MFIKFRIGRKSSKMTKIVNLTKIIKNCQKCWRLSGNSSSCNLTARWQPQSADSHHHQNHHHCHQNHRIIIIMVTFITKTQVISSTMYSKKYLWQNLFKGGLRHSMTVAGRTSETWKCCWCCFPFHHTSLTNTKTYLHFTGIKSPLYRGQEHTLPYIFPSLCANI